MIKALLVLVLWGWNVLSHPFHLSICEIVYKPEDRSLQISSRIFMDDFEMALNQTNNVDNYFDQDQKDINPGLRAFFKKHLIINVNGMEQTSTFLGYEIEDDVVWCYLEVNNIKNIERVDVKYTVLMDNFEDQINLAHIKYQGKVKSLRFQKGQISGTAVFAN